MVLWRVPEKVPLSALKWEVAMVPCLALSMVPLMVYPMAFQKVSSKAPWKARLMMFDLKFQMVMPTVLKMALVMVLSLVSLKVVLMAQRFLATSLVCIEYCLFCRCTVFADDFPSGRMALHVVPLSYSKSPLIVVPVGHRKHTTQHPWLNSSVFGHFEEATAACARDIMIPWLVKMSFATT